MSLVTPMLFAETLRAWAADKGSREDAAVLLGVKRNTLQRYLRGDLPSDAHMQRISQLIGFKAPAKADAVTFGIEKTAQLRSLLIQLLGAADLDRAGIDEEGNGLRGSGRTAGRVRG